MRVSNRYPRSFGYWPSLPLSWHTAYIYPYRRALEKWDFDKMFFRSQYFKSFSHLVSQAKGFEVFHDRNHEVQYPGGTPVEKMSGDIKYLPKDFKLPSKLGIPPGDVHLVRFIISNRILDIFGEKFSMPVELEYEYVCVTIDTG